MPTTRQPSCLAIWPAHCPTPPLAAETTTVSPGCGSHWIFTPDQAVMPSMPRTPTAVEIGAVEGSSLRGRM